jgi:hypothetical protein
MVPPTSLLVQLLALIDTLPLAPALARAGSRWLPLARPDGGDGPTSIRIACS